MGTSSSELSRPLVVLIRSLSEQGLTDDELAEAFTLTTHEVRQARFWRTLGKFTPAERAQYRDLLRYASWRLPYWRKDANGRLRLLPPEERAVRRVERDASYAGRLAQAMLPDSLKDLTLRK